MRMVAGRLVVAGGSGLVDAMLRVPGAAATVVRPQHRLGAMPGLDSNQDKGNQNPLCYRYTTGQ